MTSASLVQNLGLRDSAAKIKAMTRNVYLLTNMNEKNVYDAIVVGARIAGAGMAGLLSQAGFRVLLVDRVQFPKPTLSCPLYFGNAFAILDRMGALPRIEAIGAPKAHLYQVEVKDIHLHGHLLPYHGHDYSYSIRREIFDELLFEHVAGMPNVETRLGFNITGLLWDDSHHRVLGVKGSIGGGTPEEIRAEMVVGADGLFSVVAQQTSPERYNIKPPHTCAYYAYYSNVKPAAREPSATMYFNTENKSYCITADSDSDLTVISITLPASRFEEARRNPERVHEFYPRQIPLLAERIRNARRETPVYGVSPRESVYRVPFGPGWVLVGDAGYYKDPITGQGIHDALRSAELAAAAYTQYRAGANWNAAMCRYQLVRDRETRGMYGLTDYYAQIDRKIMAQEFSLFRAIAAQPRWANRYVSMFNGVTDVSWFIKPTTALRIYWEWQARKLLRRVTAGSHNLTPFEARE